MAYEESKPAPSEILNLQVGMTPVEGYYIRCRNGKFGFLYDFITKKGKPFTLKQNSDLVQKMAVVPEKSHCQISVTSMIKNHKGNDMKLFKVLFDVDDRYGPKGHPIDTSDEDNREENEDDEPPF